MRKVILPLIILGFLICTDRAGATVCSRNLYYYYPNGLANATGTVTATGINSIELYDEENKRTERFIYLGQGQQYHNGDYIRIYYYPQSAVVATIMKMTVLEYKENGQNLGNIFRDNRRN
jgi:hypothetical protein